MATNGAFKPIKRDCGRDLSLPIISPTAADPLKIAAEFKKQLTQFRSDYENADLVRLRIYAEERANYGDALSKRKKDELTQFIKPLRQLENLEAQCREVLSPPTTLLFKKVVENLTVPGGPPPINLGVTPSEKNLSDLDDELDSKQENDGLVFALEI